MSCVVYALAVCIKEFKGRVLPGSSFYELHTASISFVPVCEFLETKYTP